MKHIFTVHSPITFLAAYATSLHLKLKKEDIIFLTNDYKVPSVGLNVFPGFSDVHKGFWNKFLYSNQPAWSDSYINRLTENDNFTAYVDLMSYNQRILVTHSKCVQFHFIEEGNSSYRSNDSLLDMTWDKRNESYRVSNKIKAIANAVKWAYRGYTPRLLSIPYSFSAYHDFPGIKFFGFSSLAFPQVAIDKKIVLDLRKDGQWNELAGNIALKDSIIWVDGSNNRFTGLDDSFYHDAVNTAIDKLQTTLQGQTIYLKFRPGLKNAEEQFLYKALTKGGFKVEILPDQIILECVFLNATNCIVIGNLSSALFYAAIFGHKAYSIYSLFKSQPPTIFDQMPGYWHMVNRIS